MTTARSTHRLAALTRVELVALLGLGVLVFCLATVSHSLNQSRQRAHRINCYSILKSVGLSFRMWANDSGEKFPWQVSSENQGTMESAESADVFRHFIAISKELSSPKVLACPADASRSRATNWGEFDNRNLSYFVGLDASETNVQSILSGDRNILGGLGVTNRVMRFTNGSPAGWGPDLHNRQGNLGLGDGSAQQVTDSSLRKQMQSAYLGGGADVRLSIPNPNKP